MKRIDLEQGSQEWLDWRRHHRMASETPAIMNLSPYARPAQIRAAKTGSDRSYTTSAMQYGHDQEPLARADYEAATGELYEPAVFVDGEYGASVDGISMDGSTIIEIKSPTQGERSGRWHEASAGQVPDHDMAQIQHQLMVTGADRCIYIVWSGTDYASVEVTPDPEWHERIRQAWDDFWQTLAQRDDDEWRQAAEQYQAAKAARDQADRDMRQAKERLIAMTAGDYTAGAGLAVSRHERIGTIDWKAIQKNHAPDLDVEQYRSPTTTYYRLEITDEP